MKRIIAAGILFFSVFLCIAQEETHFTLNSAIVLAVQNNYEIKKQRYAIASARAQYHQAVGALDLEVGTQAQYALNHNPIDERDPRYSYSYSFMTPSTSYGIYSNNTMQQQVSGSVFMKKLFSFGLEAKLSYTLQRQHDFPQYSYGKNFDTENYSKYEHEKGRNVGQISLELSLPLFKAFKDSMTSMQIKTAKENLDAMDYALSDTLSQTMMNAASKFWNYYLAYKNLEVLQVLQEKIKARNGAIDSLIRSGVRSRNDILAMQVNEKENIRQIQEADVRFKQAKMELMQVIGVSDANIIGIPDNPFEVVNLNEIEPPTLDDVNDELFSYIEQNRPDLVAIRKRMNTYQYKMKLAKIDQRPDASINLGVGTTGAAYSDNFLEAGSAGVRNNRGVNLSGAVSVSAKLGNHSKKGAYEQAESEYNSYNEDYKKIKNTLLLQLQNCVQKLATYKAGVSDASEVMELHRNLYENEQKRFMAGLITTENLFQQDQKYINAVASYYQVLINYMQAILEYKYYSGNLVKIDSDTAFRMDNLDSSTKPAVTAEPSLEVEDEDNPEIPEDTTPKQGTPLKSADEWNEIFKQKN
ncbi:Outer membrane protein [Treponema sp. JC4]|uniref:TolC family protein n=1 Tax=Treponema sp. JC4 TaxID=1124982 RepID=UPI00025B0DFA|nr:TolC family protein [Treponema sp. JC4]EID85198.1 Outer membrane protein [Treponema sp. JC4]